MDELVKNAPLIGVLVGLITLFTVLVSIGRYTRTIEGRLERIDNRLDALSSWALGFSKEINTFFGVIVQLLSNRQQLSAEELGLVTQSLSSLGEPAVETLFERERLSRNPLAPAELSRLENYYRRAQAVDQLSMAEVDDYNRLVAILERDRPSDPGIWPLIALGAFLVGLKLGQSRGGSRP